MGIGSKDNSNEHVKKLNDIVKKLKRKQEECYECSSTIWYIFLSCYLGSPIAICLGVATFTTMMLFTDISPIEVSSMMFEKLNIIR